MLIEDGKLVITKEGKLAKFVEKVDQVSFSGKRAIAHGQDVTYVTERCVLKLTEHGLMVTEIAPGLDLQMDILDQADVALAVSPDLKTMDQALFLEQPMGLSLG